MKKTTETSATPGNAWSGNRPASQERAAQAATLVIIDSGEPGDDSKAPTCFVKSYALAAQKWTILSTFPVTDIAVSAATIFAISRADGRVYQYTGLGTSWIALAQLPGSDRASQVAVTGGVVFALASNSRQVYQYNAGAQSWTEIKTPPCRAISGNDNNLSIIATNNQRYLYDPAGNSAPVLVGTGMTKISRHINGTHHSPGMFQDVWHGHTRATSAFPGDINAVYYADNMGNMYAISPSGTITALAGYPTT